MCGGAIISDYAPLVTKAKGRKLTAEELWSELDASAADDFWGFYSTSKLHPTNQGMYSPINHKQKYKIIQKHKHIVFSNLFSKKVK
jgi:hypothetical protein